MEFYGILEFLFLALPIASAVFFIASLSVFITDRVKNKKAAESVGTEKLHNDKVLLVVSSITFGIFILIYVGLYVILINAISYM